MSRREDIDNTIWSDPDFEALTPDAKLVYIWAFTNLRCGMAGIYKLAPSAAAREIGLDDDDLIAALEELVGADFVAYETHVLWVRTRVKHLRTRTPQIARSVAKDVEKLPEAHPLRVRFLQMYANYPWLRDQLAILAPEGGWGVPAGVSDARRDEVFQRDGHRCVSCGTSANLTIDHRKPRSHGGDNSLENLQTLCRGCNSRKGPTADSAQPGGFSEPPTRPSIGTSPGGSSQNFKGKGKGSGKGNTSREGSDARATWDQWAAENVPDLPRDFAVSTAMMLAAHDLVVSPETVRARAVAQFPALAGSEAA